MAGRAIVGRGVKPSWRLPKTTGADTTSRRGSGSYTGVTADLFGFGLPAVGHGCNCTGSMGGGITRDFRLRYPDKYAEYARRCAGGDFVLGGMFVWAITDLVVYNFAT